MTTTVTDRIYLLIEKRKGLNQNRLAQTLGVSRATINGWKNGNSEPSPRIIIKLLERFPEVDANWLIRGAEIQSATNILSANTNTGINQQANGTGITISNNEQSTEIKHLRELLNEKEEQIKLLKRLLK